MSEARRGEPDVTVALFRSDKIKSLTLCPSESRRSSFRVGDEPLSEETLAIKVKFFASLVKASAAAVPKVSSTPARETWIASNGVVSNWCGISKSRSSGTISDEPWSTRSTLNEFLSLDSRIRPRWRVCSRSVRTIQALPLVGFKSAFNLN